MSRQLVLIGTGGSASDVLDIVDALAARGEEWEVRGFLDDARAPGTLVFGLPVLGPLAAAAREAGLFINVIGSDRSFRDRPAILAGTGVARERFATLVHPQAFVSPRARLGHGIYVAAGALVGGGVVVDDFATLHPGAVIGHDTTIGPYAVIAPGAIVAGLVRVGRACYIGSGATIRPGLVVGDSALVGMGAVVTRSMPAGEVWVGNPARRIRGRSTCAAGD